MTHIPENLASMKIEELVEWLKRAIPLNEGFMLATGVDPCDGLCPGTYQINVSSIYGEGEDKRPSMSLDLAKGLFYCHRTNFGGDIFNLIAGKKNIQGGEFVRIVESLKNYVIRRGHGQQQAIKTFHLPTATPQKQPTAHLISQGVPKAWKYFRMAMRAGYGANPKVRKAIEQYMGPTYHSPHYGKTRHMGPLYDYTAHQLGWCEISNALVIPYGLNGVTAMELVFFAEGKKCIGAYPFKTHRAHLAFQKLHTVNGDHSFFSGTTDRIDVELKPWPAGIGLETPPKDHSILLCEGVKDAITARFNGFFAVAHHGGAYQTHKMAQLHNLFLDKDGNELPAYIYAMVDSDEAGRKGGRKLRAAFSGRKNKPVIVDLGCHGLWGHGFDLTEFFRRNHSDGNLMGHLWRARIKAGEK